MSSASNVGSMTITRALSKLKQLDAEINELSISGNFVAIKIGQGDKAKVHGDSASVVEVERLIQGRFDKLQAKFKERQGIKAAIVKSNAGTSVTVNGKYMTVAAAIELKSTVAAKKTWVHMLKSNLQLANQSIDKANAALDQQINTLLTTAYGKEGQPSPETHDAVAKPQRELKEASLIDPKGIRNVIAEVEKEVATIETELDFILSESNSTTNIYILAEEAA